MKINHTLTALLMAAFALFGLGIAQAQERFCSTARGPMLGISPRTLE